ncbi:hypothetical protein [Algoriphagus aquimarinus]|uniref:hypothetical protein n=1 Tax=Algoriphagus aquimarinus TaxID=237018 RepID=UPI0030D77AF5
MHRFLLFVLIFCFSYQPLVAQSRQSSLSVSFPTIWSNVKVMDNWTPPTAPNYKEHLEGSTFGYGVNLNYAFQPRLIIKDKHFFVNIGAGYFNQRFDVSRPFNYNSFIYIPYYTDHYAYQCLSLSVGLTYEYSLGKKYSLTGDLFYYQLYSFRQSYTPTYSSPNRGFDGFTQFNSDKINFGRMISLSLGVKRSLGQRLSLGVQVVSPVYTRWRNDNIFDDDPSTFSHPGFSLGTSITIAYHL